MGDFSTLAIRIKELRSSLNMTQKEFSEFIGCTSATLSAYENGAKSPSLEIIKTIAQECKVSIDWLCGLSEQKNLPETFLTYEDIARTLFKIDDNIGVTFKLETMYGKVGMIFDDVIIFDFIKEWLAATDVLNSSSINRAITKNMYESWKKSKLEELGKQKLNKKIK